ncbi:MAG TPA: ABC transporter ATP-binding protein, partial [Pseudomonas sp.]|nr:ABC transporter ATP-binding protein [Pseudomonas sp.]
LLGDLQPTAGKIQYGTKLEIAYFDQLRLQLEPEKTVIDNLAEGREFITINGQDRHVLSYLGDFLFSPQRARTPVKALSGGERARLLLAKLFSKPANLLVLDEPTNDLDVETLELLEEVLLSFEGTVLMVSHDR